MVWSQQDRLVTPPVVTSDFVYLRLIGDRSIDEKDFGTIQRNRTEELEKWAEEVKKVQKYDKEVVRAIISANNHYAGFGPSTVNNFREIMGMPQVSLEERKDVSKLADVAKSSTEKRKEVYNTIEQIREDLKKERKKLIDAEIAFYDTISPRI